MKLASQAETLTTDRTGWSFAMMTKLRDGLRRHSLIPFPSHNGSQHMGSLVRRAPCNPGGCHTLPVDIFHNQLLLIYYKALKPGNARMTARQCLGYLGRASGLLVK